jgi:hypothetical protein
LKWVFTLLPQAVGAVGKWESCFGISTFPRPTVKLSSVCVARERGGGVAARAVGMWKSRAVGEISKERGKGGETRFLVFHAFHGSVISTAPSPGCIQTNRGGTGDSLLHFRSSFVFAPTILLAQSVSLIAAACRSNCAKLTFSFRYVAASGSDFNFSYGVA